MTAPRRWPVVLLPAACIAAAILWFVLPGAGGGRGDASPAAFAIRADRVFDGERIHERLTVLVRDGRVVAMGADLVVPAGVPLLDAAGATLLPGLIDAHVHAFGGGLADALNFGVTTVLDLMGDPAALREQSRGRDALRRRAHADIYGAGWAATVAGGHGTQFGPTPPPLEAAADADAWVAARIAEGSDFIKAIYEPRDPAGLGPRMPSLDAAALAALTRSARQRGKLVVAHVSRVAAAREALEVGVDGLAHVPVDRPVDAAVLELVERRRPFIIPTLAVVTGLIDRGSHRRFIAEPQVLTYLNPEQRAALAASAPGAAWVARPAVLLANTRALHAAGAEVLAGSDAPNPGVVPGASLHHELELLVSAGLPADAVLAAATAAPARRFGLHDRGRIAPGTRADLLLVAGDPLRDIRATRAILRIWKNGAPVERRRYPAAS